jgi:MauM/NapG family ferredoxin protein
VPSSKRKPGWRTRPWITLRKMVQILALLGFLVLFVGAHAGRIRGSIANLPLRLDPLAVFSSFLASRQFLTGSALALITILLTLLAGRVWCGWLCPMGTLLDLFSFNRWRQNKLEVPRRLQQVKYILLLLILFAALFTNLTLLILDPLTLLTRTMTVSVWPALDKIFTSTEAALYRLPALRSAVSVFDQWIRPELLPQLPNAYRGAALFAGIFIVLVALNIMAERFWCRYLCPLGAMLGLFSKAAILRRAVNSDCVGCEICPSSCPTGTIDPAEHFTSDPGECTMCLECLYSCPQDATSFTPTFGLAGWNTYDPSRRDVVMTLGAAVAGAALLKVDLAAESDRPHLLRPPGVVEETLLSTCVRCGQCIRACPTGGLQPALTEAGLEGLWTPMLVPRLGYCDYSCNACGMSCPVGAIPALSLEEKHGQVLGQATIDHNRCLAWSENTPCIVCEEMCPLPEKAIVLEEAEVVGINGETSLIQRPKVLSDRCVGCGICEYKCPVEGEAAIRVYVRRS